VGALAVFYVNHTFIRKQQDAILVDLRKSLIRPATLARDESDDAAQINRRYRLRELLNLAVIQISDRFIFSG
jgi:hypothetical protein